MNIRIPTSFELPEEKKLPGAEFTFQHMYMTLTSHRILQVYGDPSEQYPLASVTKPIAAWAVLVGVEKGLYSLDAPAGPEGSTIRHLLSHASGVPREEGQGRNRRPGTHRVYSNYGFDILGHEVGQIVGMPIQDWVMEAVLKPLGMEQTRIQGSIAYSGRACAGSLAKFARELMQPTLISQELYHEATTPVFDGLPGVLPGYGRRQNNTWGLGVEIKGGKDQHWTGDHFSPRTFGHFGMSGSFIWVDPDVQKAGIFLSKRTFERQHIDRWPELTNQMRATW